MKQIIVNGKHDEDTILLSSMMTGNKFIVFKIGNGLMNNDIGMLIPESIFSKKYIAIALDNSLRTGNGWSRNSLNDGTVEGWMNQLKEGVTYYAVDTLREVFEFISVTK